MERLDFKLLQAGIALETTKLKVQASLEEIEKKHPGRVDIIKSMGETKNDLYDIQASFNFLLEKYNTSSIEIHRQQSENETLRLEIKNLKKELKTIKANLEL